MDTINGYPVVKSHPTPKAPMTRAGRVVLVDRGEGTHQRWVTAWQGEGDREWWKGHYIDGETEARKDFDKRVARGW